MRQLEQESMQPFQTVPFDVNSSATADYIADMSEQLCNMAAKSRLDVLSTLLRLASVEARRITDEQRSFDCRSNGAG